ncbi:MULTISPECIES: flagellar hook-length control protein FliK [unclassified Cobetia]|uniref:flagellar hook-length control protein FliK n=1 Tax=unclassified Cobetia TaxID=2609414 RepID=UPI002096C5A3|nr:MULTISPECIES: flagellar hook-length control protein FliK [unclassified Cobetia]MCO7233169.1 flagellar hook-length control protein FliK [Cobetia sp. Dlab-2-AX]MCO7236443.1 flagellar hook-length control protein FliK [Cobetia sp. Dlab-2-U]
MTDTARISMLSATSPTLSPTRAPTSALVSSEEARSRDDVSSASSESTFEAHLSRAKREDRQQDRQAAQVQTQAQDAQQQRIERREAAEDKHAQHLEQAQAASSETSPTPDPVAAAIQNGNLPPAQPSSGNGQRSAQSLEASRLDSSVERGISRMQQLQQLTQGGQGASGGGDAALNTTSAATFSTTAGTATLAGAQALSTAANTAGSTALQGDWLATLRNPAAAGLDGAIADQSPSNRSSATAAGSLSTAAPSSLTDGALGPLTEEAIEGVIAKADGVLLDANGSRAGADQSQLSGASTAGVSAGASSSSAAGSGAMLNGTGNPAVNATGMAPQAGTLIPASVGTQAWQQALSEQVVRMQLSKSPQAEIALNPANLGKLTIRLNIGEQGTSAHFVAGHQQVRSAVESSLSELRQALESRGHELTAISFSAQDDTPDNTPGEAADNSANQGQFAQHLEDQPASDTSTSADAMEGSLAAGNLTSNLASATQAAWGQREWQA